MVTSSSVHNYWLSIVTLQSPAIKVENTSLEYAGKSIFTDLSLEFPAGKTSCLLGPSGVGKSSLLSLIAGLAPNMVGKVSADDGLALAGRLALLSQQDSLLPWLSLQNNVLLGMRLRGKSPSQGDKAKAIELLNQVGLAKVATQLPETLSGGMRQRAGIARVLFEDSPIVLLDEPFSALDVITKLALEELTVKLFVGRTVIHVTHDPLEALRIGHEIRVMSGQPASLSEALCPQGEPVRDVTDQSLLLMQGELLAKLREASLS